jgi:hypothetical protein
MIANAEAQVSAPEEGRPRGHRRWPASGVEDRGGPCGAGQVVIGPAERSAVFNVRTHKAKKVPPA